MMKRVALIAFLLGTAQAGDWAGSLLESLGSFYPTTSYIDSTVNRWELGACDSFGAFLAGRYKLKAQGTVRVYTFVGPITEKQFWKNTGRFKREPLDYGLAKAKITLVRAEKGPYPFQEVADNKYLKGTRFFVGLANVSYKPVLCSAVFYE